MKITAGSVWAITPEVLESMLVGTHDCTYEAKAASTYSNIKGNVAIIPVYGALDNRTSDWYMGYDMLGQMFENSMKDPATGAILLDIDSPGGIVFGTQELSDKIYNARGSKPIIAMVNGMTASAAYWIASAADEIVMSPSSLAGSIGVLAVHQDISKAEENFGVKTTIIKAGKYKVEANMHEPLADEARQALQMRVDEYYEAFVGGVARNRGTTSATVKADYGQGRVLGAKQAVAAGMVDRIASIDDVLARLAAKPTLARNYKAEAAIAALR